MENKNYNIIKLDSFDLYCDSYDDCVRIQNELSKNGYYADLNTCENIWSDYSNEICASWLFLPEKDNELWNILKEFLNLNSYYND